MNNHIPSSELIIRPASFEDIPFIQKVANETWPVAYAEILTVAQREYMLKLLYSNEALTQQMKDGHYFFLAILQYQVVGFCSFSPYEKSKYKLHKLYVLPHIQSKGVGLALLNIAVTTAKSMGADYLLLNVNRNNNAQHFYTKNGFKILKEEDIDIGNGYFMNDFIMEKSL